MEERTWRGEIFYVAGEDLKPRYVLHAVRVSAEMKTGKSIACARTHREVRIRTHAQ